MYGDIQIPCLSMLIETGLVREASWEEVIDGNDNNDNH